MKKPFQKEYRLLNAIRADFANYKDGNLLLAKLSREIGHNTISYGGTWMTFFIHQDAQGRRYVMIYTNAEGFNDLSDMIDKMEFMHGGDRGAQASGAKYMAILLGCLKYYNMMLASKCSDGSENVVQVLGGMDNDYTISEVEIFDTIKKVAEAAGVKDTWGEWKNCWCYEICDESADLSPKMFTLMRALGEEFMNKIDIRIPSSPRALKYTVENSNGDISTTSNDGSSGGSRLDPVTAIDKWVEKFSHEAGTFTFKRTPLKILEKIGGKEHIREIEAEIEVIPIAMTTAKLSRERYQDRAHSSSYSIKTIPVDANGVVSKNPRKHRTCTEAVMVGVTGSIFPAMFLPSAPHIVINGDKKTEYTFVVRINLYVEENYVNNFSGMNGAFYAAAGSEASTALKHHTETAIKHLMASDGAEYDEWLKQIKSEWPVVQGKYPNLDEGGIKTKDKLFLYKMEKGKPKKIEEIEQGDSISNVIVKNRDGQELTPDELETLKGIRGFKISHNKGAQRVTLECLSPYIRRGTSEDSYEFCYTEESFERWANEDERGVEYGPHHNVQLSVNGTPHYTDVKVTGLPEKKKKEKEDGTPGSRKPRSKGNGRNLSDPSTIFRTDIPSRLLVGYDKSNETLLIPDDSWFHDDLWVNHPEYIKKYEPKVKEFYSEASDFARECLHRFEERQSAKFGVCIDKVDGWGEEGLWVYISDHFEGWYERNSTAKSLRKAVNEFRERLGMLEDSNTSGDTEVTQDEAKVVTEKAELVNA